MTTPLFITFEGGEGAGKSTQIAMLSAVLDAAGQPHIVTREPGGSDGAEAIRTLVVTGEVERWDPLSETLLFMAARAHHIEHTIKPALASGKWVLCDRFFDSTRVYQGIAKGLGDNALLQLYRQCFGTFWPDITLLFDIDPKAGLDRTVERGGRETRFEQMDIGFHQMVREGFLSIAKAESQRCHIIDAERSIQDVHETICNKINSSQGMLNVTPQEVAA